MRAIINIVFQFVLACGFLVCITCSRFEENSSTEDPISKRESEFVVRQITATSQLIELADIGGQKGNGITLLKAQKIKDNQVALLYYWMDYATKKDIEIPAIDSDSSAKILYNKSDNFDEEWNTVVDQRTVSLLSSLTTHSREDDNEMNAALVEVMNIFEINVNAQDVHLVAGN